METVVDEVATLRSDLVHTLLPRSLPRVKAVLGDVRHLVPEL